jgi:Family of unknown function (DUF5709)
VTQNQFENGPFEDRDTTAAYPEVIDDDSPERDTYPEPEGPALPSDTGYTGSDSVGVTVEEEIEGESLEQKLARERADPQVDPLAARGVADERVESAAEDGREPVGQLIQPDAGGAADTEKDEIAQQFPGEAVSPEERAMHVEPGPA